MTETRKYICLTCEAGFTATVEEAHAEILAGHEVVSDPPCDCAGCNEHTVLDPDASREEYDEARNTTRSVSQMTTREILTEIGRQQGIQKQVPPNSDISRAVSRALAPLFKEMARRQKGSV